MLPEQQHSHRVLCPRPRRASPSDRLGIAGVSAADVLPRACCTHNRHRDWHEGNHPGYALARWLADHADEVWLYITAFEVEWTNNASERAIKDPKRHQAVSGYWHTQQTLGRFCRIRPSSRPYATTVSKSSTQSTSPLPETPSSPPSPQPDHTASPS